MAVSTFKYKGKRIYLADYSDQNEAELFNTLNEVAEFCEKLDKKVLWLCNFEGTTITTVFANAVNTVSKEKIVPKVEKAAIIGISPIRKVLLNYFNSFTGGHFVGFSDEESAKEYLVE